MSWTTECGQWISERWKRGTWQPTSISKIFKVIIGNFFSHHFSLIVGDWVPDVDPVRQLVVAAIIMPIEFQIRKFFELPNVFEKVKSNTDKSLQGNKIDHFIKGKLWKEKIKSYGPDQVVIPFHFYGDGAQANLKFLSFTYNTEKKQIINCYRRMRLPL